VGRKHHMVQMGLPLAVPASGLRFCTGCGVGLDSGGVLRFVGGCAFWLCRACVLADDRRRSVEGLKTQAV
jgi:hypothetical protein